MVEEIAPQSPEQQYGQALLRLVNRINNIEDTLPVVHKDLRDGARDIKLRFILAAIEDEQKKGNLKYAFLDESEDGLGRVEKRRPEKGEDGVILVMLSRRTMNKLCIKDRFRPDQKELVAELIASIYERTLDDD